MVLTLFQGHSCVEQFWLKKIYVLIWLGWNFVGLLCTPSRSKQIHCYWLWHIFEGDNRRVSWFDKSFIVGFFTDTVLARFFKNCITITLFWGSTISYQFWWPWPCFKVTDMSESWLQIVLFVFVFVVVVVVCFSRFLSTVILTLCGSYMYYEDQAQHSLCDLCI